MAEPTAQVPASLIEDELAYRVRTAVTRVRMAERHGEPYPRDWVENQISAGRERIRALLSQPTPTCEQIAESMPGRVEIHRIICGQFGGPSTHDHQACENAANAVHAALLNGAERD